MMFSKTSEKIERVLRVDKLELNSSTTHQISSENLRTRKNVS